MFKKFVCAKCGPHFGAFRIFKGQTLCLKCAAKAFRAMPTLPVSMPMGFSTASNSVIGSAEQEAAALNSENWQSAREWQTEMVRQASDLRHGIVPEADL